MMDIVDTVHFEDMQKERGIKLEWLDRTMQDQDRTEDRDDGTRHFLKQIPEYGNRWLRVVVNMTVTPKRRVTVYFDRKLGRTA